MICPNCATGLLNAHGHCNRCGFPFSDEPTPQSCKLLSRILIGWTLLVALLIFGLVKACSP